MMKLKMHTFTRFQTSMLLLYRRTGMTSLSPEPGMLRSSGCEILFFLQLRFNTTAMLGTLQAVRIPSLAKESRERLPGPYPHTLIYRSHKECSTKSYSIQQTSLNPSTISTVLSIYYWTQCFHLILTLLV